jgi:transposase, IS30 family
MTYKQLSQNERYQIFALMKAGFNQSKIASVLGRHKSTIAREIHRNTGKRGYRPRQACLIAKKRSERCRNARKISLEILNQAFEFIKIQWSPEQVSSRLSISHESVYRHIYKDRQCGGTIWQSLRCQKKKKKRYGSGHGRRGQIIGKRPIIERPEIVDKRLRIGDWEGDTVIGAGHKQAIVSLVERKSGYTILAKVPNKTANLVGNAIIKHLSPIREWVKTITFDNGKEFANHKAIDNALNSTTYFADPFSSWQRGCNENLNGLLRQYIPKKRPLSTVTENEIKMIEQLLNNRPRKRLGFKTPNEIFFQYVNVVALRT